jgi:hypothetical protein
VKTEPETYRVEKVSFTKNGIGYLMENEKNNRLKICNIDDIVQNDELFEVVFDFYLSHQ